jgi:hypothetical protein
MNNKRKPRPIMFSMDDAPVLPPTPEAVPEPEPEPKPAGLPHIVLGKPVTVEIVHPKKKKKKPPDDTEALLFDLQEEFSEEFIPLAKSLDQLQTAALMMASKVESIDDSPWLLPEGQDQIGQLAFNLQDQNLVLVGPDVTGFISFLDNLGRRLRFEPATPRTDEPLFPGRLAERTRCHLGINKGNSIADITYWNVRRSWSDLVRSVTIPVCRVCGFRGLPVLGTGVRSVRRALAHMGPHCPCGKPFHITSDGSDARTIPGHDLLRLRSWGWQDGEPMPLPQDTLKQYPPADWKPLHVPDPFAT